MDKWYNFFLSAGIPSSFARQYAEIFVQNRIRSDQVADISREDYHSMGIATVGDILAIRKAIQQNGLPIQMTQTEGLLRKPDSQQQMFSNSTRSQGGPSLSNRLQSVNMSANNQQSTNSTFGSTGNASMMFRAENNRNRDILNSNSNSNTFRQQASSSRNFNDFQPRPIVFDMPNSRQEQRLEVPVPTRRRVTKEIEGNYKINYPKGNTDKTKRLLLEMQEKKIMEIMKSRNGFENLSNNFSRTVRNSDTSAKNISFNNLARNQNDGSNRGTKKTVFHVRLPDMSRNTNKPGKLSPRLKKSANVPENIHSRLTGVAKPKHAPLAKVIAYTAKLRANKNTDVFSRLG
jgi:hypothetical protein